LTQFHGHFTQLLSNTDLNNWDGSFSVADIRLILKVASQDKPVMCRHEPIIGFCEQGTVHNVYVFNTVHGIPEN